MDAPEVNQSVPQLDRSVAVARPSKETSEAPEVAKVKEVDPYQQVEDLEKAVNILNETVKKEGVDLNFRLDETLNRPVVTVLSEKTGEVVRQLPQDEVLRAVKNIDHMRGIIFDSII